MSLASKIASLFGTGTTKIANTYLPVHSVNGLTNGAIVLSGTPVQVVETDLATSGTAVVVIPNDDSIPQISEGTEIMTATITPKFATSTLYVEALVNGTTNTQGAHVVVAIFRDSGANAIAVGSVQTPNTSYNCQASARVKVAAGSTAETTFKVRVGPSSAVTMTYNGQSAARMFGGAMISSIRVTEVLA